jgi:Ring finger domain
VPVVMLKPSDDSGETATDIEDLSLDGCMDDISLNEDNNPKAQPSCAICLEIFRNGDEISYSHDPLCRHEYHTTCIMEWLLKHLNCPYCRRFYIPVPPPVKKASMANASTEPHPSSRLGEAAVPASLSTSSIHSSPRVEPIDVERGEGASSSVEALPRNSRTEGDARISI